MNCLTEEIHKVCLTQFTKPGFAVYSAFLCVINDSFLRKKKKIYNEIIFSLEATPVPWVSAWKAELFNLFPLPRGLEMHWLSQGILSSAKSTQKPMIFSKLLVNSLTLSLFLFFLLPPLPARSWHEENNSAISHIAVIWAGFPSHYV